MFNQVTEFYNIFLKDPFFPPLLCDKDHYSKYIFISRLNRWESEFNELMKGLYPPISFFFFFFNFPAANVLGKHWASFNHFDFNHKRMHFPVFINQRHSSLVVGRKCAPPSDYQISAWPLLWDSALIFPQHLTSKEFKVCKASNDV